MLLCCALVTDLFLHRMISDWRALESRFQAQSMTCRHTNMVSFCDIGLLIDSFWLLASLFCTVCLKHFYVITISSIHSACCNKCNAFCDAPVTKMLCHLEWDDTVFGLLEAHNGRSLFVLDGGVCSILLTDQKLCCSAVIPVKTCFAIS